MNHEQFHALTGLSIEEGNQVLLTEFSCRCFDRGPDVYWKDKKATQKLPVRIEIYDDEDRIVEKCYDWPTRDLNLMALIEIAMTPEEWQDYLGAFRWHLNKLKPVPETFWESPFWGLQESWEYRLLTADPLTRACAAILALKLGRTVSAGEPAKETE